MLLLFLYSFILLFWCFYDFNVALTIFMKSAL